MSARSRVLVADIGNTALKLVEFDGRGRCRRTHRAMLGPAPLSLPRWCRAGPVVAVCVASRHLAAVEVAVGAPVLLLGRDFPVDAPNGTARPAETGLDRVAAAAAAHARARGAAVAVGVGTAVTVDLVDARGTFLGGAIAPGPRAAAAGLAAAAPALPAPGARPPRAVRFPGTTTRRAMAAGLLLGTAGLVDRLVGEGRAALRSPGDRRPPPAFAAGGDLGPLLPLLREPVTPVPHLVAEGVRILWLRAASRE